MQHLYLDGGEILEETESAMDQGWSLDCVLHLDYSAKLSCMFSKTLELRPIDMRERLDASDDDDVPRVGPDMLGFEKEAVVYPALEKLIVDGCKFNIR
jgi:hypothetical protein